MDQPPSQEIPDWSARQVVIATLFVIAVFLAFFLLYRFSRIVLILVVSILLGTAIRPAVDWLNRRGFSRQAGGIVIYLLLLAIIIGVLVSFVPLIANQLTAIAIDLPGYYDDLRGEFYQSNSRVLQYIATQLPADLPIEGQPLPSDTGTGDEGTEAEQAEEMRTQVAQTLTYAGLVARGALVLVAVFILGFYWTLESERTIRSLLFLLPSSRREDVRELIGDIEDKVGGFIIGQSILCLFIGALALIAYLLIGLPYALVLAILAGLLEAVPIIGPILGAVPPLLIALSTDPSKIVWVLVATAVIQAAENYLLVPRIMNRQVGVHPMLTLLALAALTSLLGLIGAVLAVPIAAIFQLLLDRFVFTPAPVEEQAQEQMGRDQLSLLRYETQNLAQDILKQFRQKENPQDGSMDQAEESIETIAGDLNRILEQIAHREAPG